MRAVPTLVSLTFAALLGASAAEAATVAMPTPAKTILTPEFGERLDMRVSITKRLSKGVLILQRADGGSLRLTAGENCSQDGASEVSCFLPSTNEFGPLYFVTELGPLDDVLKFTGGGPEARGRFFMDINTGAGDDRVDIVTRYSGTRLYSDLVTGDGHDTVFADAQRSNVTTGDGDDVIDNHSGASSLIDSGAGNDDIVERGAAPIRSGDGDDKVIGPGSQTIDGGAGNDDIWCGYGCTGNVGDDKLRFGADQFGGPGNDTLTHALNSASGDGCSGGWTTCAAGPAGDDTINVADLTKRDGYSTATRSQRVACGGGQDAVTYDLRDEPAADCETKTLSTGAPGA